MAVVPGCVFGSAHRRGANSGISKPLAHRLCTITRHPGKAAVAASRCGLSPRDHNRPSGISARLLPRMTSVTPSAEAGAEMGIAFSRACKILSHGSNAGTPAATNSSVSRATTTRSSRAAIAAMNRSACPKVGRFIGRHRVHRRERWRTRGAIAETTKNKGVGRGSVSVRAAGVKYCVPS
jgi:hypothetical protein